VTRRRERRRKKLLDDLMDRRGNCQLKEESLDRTMWRNRFGRGFGTVVWQIIDDDDINENQPEDLTWTSVKRLHFFVFHFLNLHVSHMFSYFIFSSKHFRPLSYFSFRVIFSPFLSFFLTTLGESNRCKFWFCNECQHELQSAGS